jgi:hypothetical protein
VPEGLRSQRYVVVYPAPYGLYLLNEILQVQGVIYKVDLRGINDKQRRIIIIEKILIIRLDQRLEILGRDRALVLNVPLINPI